jgi:ATP-binding cassette subfamily B (MDR/TAP) protein 6
MLGSIYRSINRSLVDAEKLLELLNEPTDVNDKPGAPDLLVTDGEIEFGMSYCFALSTIDSMRL